MRAFYLFQLLLCLIGAGMCAKVYSQPPEFTHFSINEGLSHSRIHCIHQDREGFMWFGTSNGLNRFDGYTFTVYQPDPKDPQHSLRHNIIWDICEDQTGKLWIATVGEGIHQVDKRTGKAIAYRTPYPDQNICYQLCADRHGKLWLATEGGLNQFDPATGQFTYYASPDPKSKAIRAVLEDNRGSIWVGTATGLFQLNRQTGRFTRFALPGDQDGMPDFVIAIYQDSGGTLWVASLKKGLYQLDFDTRQQTYRHPKTLYLPGDSFFPNSLFEDSAHGLWIGTHGGGLKRLDKATGQWIVYRPNASDKTAISNNIIWSVYEDRWGTLWVGTNNGLNQASPVAKKFRTYQITVDQELAQLERNDITSILKDRSGKIWLGNYHYEDGLLCLDSQGNLLRRYHLPPVANRSRLSNRVSALFEDHAGNLWVGTPEGLHQLDQAKGQFTRYPTAIGVSCIQQDQAGALWVGGQGGIARLHKGNLTYYLRNPQHQINSLLTDSSGTIWIAIQGKGLSRLDAKPDKPVRYATLNIGNADDFTSRDITVLHKDLRGSLWMGTNLGGLKRLNLKRGTVTTITTRDGLPSNHIDGILEDNKGNLWLSTDKGLCCYSVSRNICRNYDEQDGLQGKEFNQAFARSQQGELIFGGRNGFNLFQPDLLPENRQMPPVFITAMKVLDKAYPLSDRIELSHEENSLSFEFVGLNYVLPAKNQYAYQLKGVDKTWTLSGTRRYTSYTNLDPGSYTFRVKASNNDGIWNQTGRSVAVIVHPPWWATWWAYLIYALSFGGALLGFVRFRIHQARQQQEILLKQREAEQLRAVDELKTRFFSNITHEFRTPLSLILSPTEKLLQETRYDTDTHQTLSSVHRNARQLLRLINQLLDLSKLEAGNMNVSLARGQVGRFMKQLLDAFQPLAHQKGIQLSYTAIGTDPERLFDADKLEKIIYNLVSNALKFTDEGGQVTVKVEADDTTARIVVADTGRGIPADKLPHIFDRFYQVDDSRTRAHEGTGIGLALVKELTELMQGSISVNSTVDVGTTFTLQVPMALAQGNEQAASLPQLETLSPALIFAPVSLPSTDDSSKPLVLVVEDNTELRSLVASELAAHARVLTAADGQEGWQRVQTELPDVVVSDVMMPQMDGYELTRLIKQESSTSHIAVVLLTAKAAHPSRIEGLQQGADDYLTKPFHFDELHLRLRNLLERQGRLREYHHRQLTSADTTLEPKQIEDPFLKQVYECIESRLDDSEFSVEQLAEMSNMSRRTLHRKLTTLTNLSANDVIRNYRVKRAAELLRQGHAVSETAYLVGFENPTYFSTVFKQIYNQTPSEFAVR
ncbi:two-component regulator propeller domain-containing protein [Nibrella saemangeumensis]|uniref:histidine kinase n=1 Tax=Nibrella saemangeumensis TaxID=1084526 RepID=A0ABP8MJP4_9BACT